MGSRLARRGFTMVEMIVAIAVSTIVVSGLYGLFTVQSRQFVYQDLRMSMHQNLRFGMDIVTRTVRMAGYGTGSGTNGLWGWDGSDFDDDDSLPPIVSYNGWDGTHDAITVVYGDPSLELATSVLSTHTCEATELNFPMGTRNYSSLITNYNSGELLMCWDVANVTGIESYLWEIDAAGNASSGTIGVLTSTLYDDYDLVCETGDNLPPAMSCSKAHVVTFYIDDTDDDVGPGSAEHPVLMMDLDMDFPAEDDVPLVDDIEDLQLAYCVADGGATTTGCTWINDDDLTNAEAAAVWMVRVTMIARTPRPDPRDIHVESRPETIEDYDASGEHDEDNYYRQALTTVVTARNLRM